MTRLDDLHASIADWFVQRGGKVDELRNEDFKLTEIKTTSWTVFIGPDSWGEEAYALQTKRVNSEFWLMKCTIKSTKIQ